MRGIYYSFLFRRSQTVSWTGIAQPLQRFATARTVQESNPSGGRDLRPSTTALEPTQPPVQWIPGLFPGGKAVGAWRWPLPHFKRRGWSRSRPIPLLPLRTYVACCRMNCTFLLYLFSDSFWIAVFIASDRRFDLRLLRVKLFVHWRLCALLSCFKMRILRKRGFAGGSAWSSHGLPLCSPFTCPQDCANHLFSQIFSGNLTNFF